MISKQTAPLFAGAGALRSSRGEPESEYPSEYPPPPKKGVGAKNEARGEGVILWIHDCLYAPPHPSIAQSSSSCSSAQKCININTYPSNPVPSIPPSKKRKKKIITLGYQLIKPSRQPLLAQKPRKDNKGKVLGSNKRIEINTVPRDLPLSHCNPPQ